MKLAPLVNRLTIVNKDGDMVPLNLEGDFAWAQRELLKAWEDEAESGNPIRFIILKARQLGISTLVQGILFCYSFIFDNMRGMVIADEQDNSEHLLSMSETYWDNWQFAPLWTPKYQSRKMKEWEETGSGITVKTARNVRAGRSRTIRFLHGSEVAFWPDPKQLMKGLRQAVPDRPDTAIVLESTANGVGNYFQQEWKKAEQGDSDFIPLFFPWWRHPEYTASHVGIEPYNLDPLNDEEKILRNMGISDDRLAWRRWAIINKMDGSLDGFHQEYPSTPDEAFVATGNNVFPYANLVKNYEPRIGRLGRLVWDGPKPNVRFIDDPRGNLRLFKEPSADRDWGVYVIGGDPTHTTRGDAAVGQVINRRTCEQVAVFRAKMDPGTFAEELAKLGWYYHEALLVPETEGPGYMCWSEDTEVLTKERGWKQVSELLESDVVATRNPETKMFEWQAPIPHVYDYAGELVRLYGTQVDLLVTPNHRILLNRMPRSLGGNSNQREPGEAIVTAEELEPIHNYGTHAIPAWCEWEGKPVIARVFEGRQDATGRSFPVEMTGDDFCAFMGAYLAEGCTRETNKGAGRAVHIAQRAQSKGFTAYRELLSRIVGREVNHLSGMGFVTSRYALAEYVRQFGKRAREKFIPDEIMQATPEQLRLFLYFFWLGDGHREHPDHPTKETYAFTTTSPKMAEQIQEIAIKLGLGASIQERPPVNENCAPTFTVRMLRARNRHFRMSRETYKGEVNCVEVPNTIILVRRNGKIVWTGNTVGRLQGLSYPNIWRHTKPDKTMGKISGDRWGWMTNMQSKHLAIGWLLKVIMDDYITIHDRQTFAEMRDYVTLDDGGYGPADGTENDDTVMAAAIGVTAHMMEPPLPAYGEGAFLVPNPAQELMDDPPWKSWGEEGEWAV